MGTSTRRAARDLTRLKKQLDLEFDALPEQTGHSGEYLTTDGTTATWSAITADVSGPASSTADAVVIFNGTTGKIIKDSARKFATASGVPTLDSSTKVVQDPANATATPTASKIPIADGSGKLDSWVSDGSTTVKGKVELATDGETNSGVAVQGNDSRLAAVGGKQVLQGWPLHTDGTPSVTVSYDPSTLKVTITAKSGGTITYYYNGTAITEASPHVSAAHTGTTGLWFYYHNGTSWVWDANAWDLMLTVPTCLVYYNAVLADGFAHIETHTTSRDLAMHRLIHEAQGTQLSSGGVLGDYTINGNTDAAVRFSISECMILDEDLKHTLATWTDNSTAWTIFSRSGTSGIWAWTITNAMPYLYGTYPKRNYDAGGLTGWTTTDIGVGKYVPYYVLATPATNATNYRFILIPGQTEYSSLSLAQGEQFANLSLGTMPFAEFCVIAQVVFDCSAGYGTTGKGRLQGVTRILGTRVAVTAAAATTHNSLSGLQGGTTGQYYHLTGTEYTYATTAFTGDSGAGGTLGLVPAPAAGDAAAGKVLGADGTWVAGGGVTEAQVGARIVGGV